MGSPSKIRRLSALAAKRTPRSDSDQDEFEQLFDTCLHHQEKHLYRRIMSDLEDKVGIPTELHRLDYALAVVNGLILCRLTDCGNHDEAAQVAVGWNRHSKPLISELNSKQARRDGKHGRGSVLDIFQDILAADEKAQVAVLPAATGGDDEAEYI